MAGDEVRDFRRQVEIAIDDSIVDFTADHNQVVEAVFRCEHDARSVNLDRTFAHGTVPERALRAIALVGFLGARDREDRRGVEQFAGFSDEPGALAIESYGLADCRDEQVGWPVRADCRRG